MGIVVVGRFPPPIGGVSVFVSRRYSFLEPSGARFVDLGVRWWWWRLFVFSMNRSNFFEVNTTNINLLLYLFLIGVLRRVALYDHNSSRHVWGKGWQEFIYLRCLRSVREVRVVHEHLVAAYEQRGFGGKVTVHSPFLPPREETRCSVVQGFPVEVRRFISKSDGLRIATSAWKYVPHEDGDLYGIQDFVRLVEHFSEGVAEVRFLLAVGEFRRDEWPAELLAKIERLVADGRLVLMIGQLEFWPLYKDLDLFMRLTATDGNSVSILESLFYRCPVVASDVVPRPDGVSLYKYQDFEDLKLTVLEVLSTRSYR